MEIDFQINRQIFPNSNHKIIVIILRDTVGNAVNDKCVNTFHFLDLFYIFSNRYSLHKKNALTHPRKYESNKHCIIRQAILLKKDELQNTQVHLFYNSQEIHKYT